MEWLAPYMTAFTGAISILSALWIIRRTKRVDTLHFVFSIGVMIYTFYHFYACSILGIVDPLHGLITGLFISSVAVVNAYCSTCNTVEDVNIGVCRRKNEAIVIEEDRRKVNSHTIFKSSEKI